VSIVQLLLKEGICLTYVMFLLSVLAVLLLLKLKGLRKRGNSALLSPPPEYHRLSQPEIDELVILLLTGRMGPSHNVINININKK